MTDKNKVSYPLSINRIVLRHIELMTMPRNTIVLTADRSLMSRFPTLLDGVIGSLNTTSVPRWLYDNVFAPAIRPGPDGSAPEAPYGLRKLESFLSSNGFKGQVMVTTPDTLQRVVDKGTRVIGITSSDPMGLATTNSTVGPLLGGELMTAVLFRRLMEDVRSIKKKSKRVKVIFGGAGSWQVSDTPEPLDCVFQGHVGKDLLQIVKKATAGKDIPAIVKESSPEDPGVSSIKGPSMMGVIEISRGCGRGCTFCAQARDPMFHVPLKAIEREVKRNVAGGHNICVALSEDLLRYGSEGMRVRPKKVKALCETLNGVDGVDGVQFDFVSLDSVAQAKDDLLEEVHRTAEGRSKRRYHWIEYGVETASPKLLRRVCRKKASDEAMDDWPNFVTAQTGRVNDIGFFPYISVVMGLPRERPEDVLRTIELVDDLKRFRCVVFPMFFTALNNPKKSFTMDKMTETHWDLIDTAYSTMYKWTPWMYWQTQSASGMALHRRIGRRILSGLSMRIMKGRVKKAKREALSRS